MIDRTAEVVTCIAGALFAILCALALASFAIPGDDEERKGGSR